MSHEDYQLRISKFADNILEESETAGLFIHLGSCKECREFFQATFQMRLRLQNATPISLPEEIDARVFAATIYKGPNRIASRTENLFVKLWRERISFPVPVAVTLLAIFLTLSIGLGSLWTEQQRKTANAKPEVLYIPMLPTVEVLGFYERTPTQ